MARCASGLGKGGATDAAVVAGDGVAVVCAGAGFAAPEDSPAPFGFKGLVMLARFLPGCFYSGLTTGQRRLPVNFSSSLRMPSIRASGRGGQPGMKTSTGN